MATDFLCNKLVKPDRGTGSQELSNDNFYKKIMVLRISNRCLKIENILKVLFLLFFMLFFTINKIMRLLKYMKGLKFLIKNAKGIMFNGRVLNLRN